MVLAACSPKLVVPETYPELDAQSARDAVVVAMIEPGAYLPQFEDCKKPQAICIDPPPFWIRGRLQRTVFGPSPSNRFVASTTDHFGMEGGQFVDGPSLLRLLGDGRVWIMPRYARVDVYETKGGESFVVLWRSGPIWWLPCEVMSLIEPIAPEDFKESLVLPLDFLKFFSDEELEKEQTFFEVSPSGVTPKFGISIAKLSRFLKDRYSTLPLTDCRQEPRTE